MKSYIFSIISAVLFAAGASAQLLINTPTNVVSCSPLQISFGGGTGPYIISIHPGATPNDPPLATFSNITGSPFTLSVVNYPAGTSLDLTIRDSTGASAQSAPFTVQTGASTSCLNGTTASGSGAPAATTPASSPTTAAGTTTGSTTQSKAGSSGSSTSKAASPSSSGNAAVVASIPYGVAVLGAFVAAIFV